MEAVADTSIDGVVVALLTDVVRNDESDDEVVGGCERVEWSVCEVDCFSEFVLVISNREGVCAPDRVVVWGVVEDEDHERVGVAATVNVGGCDRLLERVASVAVPDSDIEVVTRADFVCEWVGGSVWVVVTSWVLVMGRDLVVGRVWVNGRECVVVTISVLVNGSERVVVTMRVLVIGKERVVVSRWVLVMGRVIVPVRWHRDPLLPCLHTHLHTG